MGEIVSAYRRESRKSEIAMSKRRSIPAKVQGRGHEDEDEDESEDQDEGEDEGEDEDKDESNDEHPHPCACPRSSFIKWVFQIAFLEVTNLPKL